jgi:anti-sigma regulatory factor (Ser/Thr protein kinase)/biotin operon repressor
MSSNVRIKGEQVRLFILNNLEKHPNDIVNKAGQHFGITRQAVFKHLTKLRSQGTIIKNGVSRNASYELAEISSKSFDYELTATLAEDIVWTKDIKRAIEPLPNNILNIWQHGFTEMFNNAIDHSSSAKISVSIKKTAIATEIIIQDFGIGIFKKIQSELNLLDEKHAIFELSKGKLTTDPSKHSGEGIFFTSRMFEKFDILSGDLFFSHDKDGRDWLGDSTRHWHGTTVVMEINNHSAQTTKKIFDQYSSGEDYGFNRTVVPVSLAKFDQSELISRSQAKRLLTRIELFKDVVFDFTGVEIIGQAFADQIFRVFANEHPDIDLHVIGANASVMQMISRARNIS